MTEGISAFGTTLQWNTEPIAELTSISGPTLSMDTLDLSHHESPGGFREFGAGLGDAGEISIEGNFISGDVNGQIALMDALLERTPGEIIITFPDDSMFTADALVTAFEPSAAFDDKLSFSATLKLSGLPEFIPPGS